MSDLIHKQWQVASALILVLYWGFVFMLPFMILAQIMSKEPTSGIPLPVWCVLSASIGYFSYTGVRAWRRKWKARFILRIVVPAALLFSACVLIGTFAWFG
jgi:hypothetical protein